MPPLWHCGEGWFQVSVAEYVPPILTVDAVLFQVRANEQLGGKLGLEVLLIRRPNEPFSGQWALPGGYNPRGETTLAALERIVHTKAGLQVGDLAYMEQLYTFDTVARDPRGHAVSVTYLGCGRGLEPHQAGAETGFFAVSELPEMAYDHDKIISFALERLRSKLNYTNAAFAFLPPQFTLSALQQVYESVFMTELDKRNFRKKFLASGLLQPTEDFSRQGAHRPARLYEFNAELNPGLSDQFHVLLHPAFGASVFPGNIR